MNNKQYPTRMHEVLGVEAGEIFQIKGQTPLHNQNFYVDKYGDVRREGWSPPLDRAAAYLINHPECIIRKPRLTEEQVAHLNGLLLLGFRKIQKDYKKSLIAYGGSKVTEWTLPISTQDILLGLVIDPEPLDIVATLRDAGVEVEE